MYCKYLRNVKTYEAEIWYAMLIYDADFCYDIDILMVPLLTKAIKFYYVIILIGCGATCPRIKVFSLNIALILHTLKNNTFLVLPKTSKQ